jgi:ubiquinone biosynthesis protein
MITSGIKHKIEYLKRYRNILGIMLKYGFGHIVEKLNIEYYFEYGERLFFGKGDINHEKQKLNGPVRLRLVFEELGPTFIKFGQIISTRADMLPIEYIKELEKLQDGVESVDFAYIEKIIEDSYGKPKEEIFKYVAEKPLGSASIAQVHRAILKSGEEIVLKIKKPGIDHIIELDTAILYNIAMIIEKRIPELEYYNPVKIVNEFSSTIKKELDFTREGRNNDIIRTNFRNEKDFIIPKIYWDYTTKNILAMEYIIGETLSEFTANMSVELGKELANRGANIFLKQILEDGFFHADPHPGNIFIVNKKEIAFIDYGMVGVLDEENQENLAEILAGVVLRDAEKILVGFEKFGTLPDELNRKALKAEINELLDKYYNITLKNINIGKLMDELYQVVIRHKIYIPATFFLVGKTLMTIDGIARILSPDFDMAEVSKPFVRKLLLQKFSPENLFNKFKAIFDIYKKIGANLPIDISQIFNKIKKDKLQIEVRSRDIADFGRTIDRVINRLAASIIIAGILIGSSMLINSQVGYKLQGYSILGVSGYIFAGAFGVFLIIDIMRK